MILGVCGASARVLAGISARRRQGCAAPEAAGSNWFWPSPLQGAAELPAGAARAAVENTAQLGGARIKVREMSAMSSQVRQGGGRAGAPAADADTPLQPRVEQLCSRRAAAVERICAVAGGSMSSGSNKLRTAQVVACILNLPCELSLGKWNLPQRVKATAPQDISEMPCGGLM